SAHTRRPAANGGRRAEAGASRHPARPWRPPRNCPRDSAGRGKTACSRGSRPRSSPRATRRRWPRGSCPAWSDPVRSCGGLLCLSHREQIGVEAVIIHEVVQNLPEYLFVLFHHLGRLEQRIASVAQKLHIAEMQRAILVVWVALHHVA